MFLQKLHTINSHFIYTCPSMKQNRKTMKSDIHSSLSKKKTDLISPSTTHNKQPKTKRSFVHALSEETNQKVIAKGVDFSYLQHPERKRRSPSTPNSPDKDKINLKLIFKILDTRSMLWHKKGNIRNRKKTSQPPPISSLFSPSSPKTRQSWDIVTSVTSLLGPERERERVPRRGLPTVQRMEIDSESGSGEGVHPPVQPGRHGTQGRS